MINPCPAEYIRMPHPLLILSQSDSLIQIVDINSHAEWQTVQIRSVGFFRNQLIWIYTVCKGRVDAGSAGQALNLASDRTRKYIIKHLHLNNDSDHTTHVC